MKGSMPIVRRVGIAAGALCAVAAACVDLGSLSTTPTEDEAGIEGGSGNVEVEAGMASTTKCPPDPVGHPLATADFFARPARMRRGLRRRRRT